MIKWLRKKLGIIDVENRVAYLHKDINEAFNRLDKIESPQQSARRKARKESQRHDEIERERKHRKKDHLRGKGK
jgi:hypothetical protein